MSTVQLIDESAIIWSAPADQRAGRPLLVLLHGYGSHEGDLFGLSPHLPLQPVIAQNWLPRHSTLTERIYEGLGHSVSEAELADVLTFLRAQYT